MTTSNDHDQNGKSQGSIYYDASCPICSNFVAGLTQKETNYSYVDSNNSKPPSVSEELPRREIIYVTNEGKVLGNIDAIFQIFDDAKRLRWLTWLGRTRLLKPVFLLGYRIFAANRHRVSWLLGMNNKSK